MIHRTLAVALAASIVALALPSIARAGSTPFTVGIGQFVPTSSSSNIENFAPLPGTTVKQRGNLGFDVSFGRGIIPGGYELTALFLSQHQTVSPMPVPGLGPQDITITQVPVLIESGTQFAVVRFGGGLGYDFVSYPAASGAPRANGIVGDTFLEVGAGSNAAVQAKLFFGQRSALNGLYVGIKTQL